MYSMIELQTPAGPVTGGVPAGAPFTFMEESMSKPFLSFQDQIGKLRSKNLTISDSAYAERILREIGYFGLIGGYKEPFKNPTTKKYKDGTTFESIVELYKFDENLRELFLKYILKIERHIRSLLSYYFTAKYGENQCFYLDANSYVPFPSRSNDISKLIGILTSLANKNSDYPYINHQRLNYGNVPLWVLVNGLTFGTLSKFYALVKPDIRTKISENFDAIKEKQLAQYLKVITKFRNVCAHNERLFSFQTKNDIPNTILHEKLSIPQKGTQYLYGKRDLFALVIAFRYLLSDEDFKKFKRSLSLIFSDYLSKEHSLSQEDIYALMGFPSNWKNITKYKK